MIAQIGRMLRPSPFRKIATGRHDHMHVDVRQPPRPQRTVRHVGDANGVQPTIDDVDMRIDDQVDLHRGCSLVNCAINGAMRNSQVIGASRTVQQIHRFIARASSAALPLGHDAMGMVSKSLHRFRSTRATTGPAEQAGVEMLFQAGHGFGNGGLRHAERLRRIG